ncbi:hypothetical protein [Marinomonas foliarum]|uniref:ATP-binding protein n=1 Tax=Marinomonas foliarum TaxID=491950 RepID=A0A368ZMR3_9GAMM|nr:hypothetical protein [Marinomonas foliarum]RCW96327.1 hypothetical protein DFP77_13530 [Marinomonas foliarum]
MSIKNKIHINTHYTRSINLERDANSLEVVNSYIPTSRAMKLFGRMADGFNSNLAPRAWSLIGPYGSGKSSASVFLSHLLSSPDLSTTQAALKNLKETAPDVATQFRKETSKSNGFLNVLITGSPEPMGNKIIQGLASSAQQYFSNFNDRNPKVVSDLENLSKAKSVSTSEIISLIKDLQSALTTKGCKGIYIVIDELGKFLEFEARHYGANDIYMLQALAEHACKGDECNLFLFVLLHQSFEQYAKGLGESLKNEWAKVQGRFEDVPFLESAEQVLRVVSAAFSYDFTQKEERQLNATIKGIVDILQENDAFSGVADKKTMADLMSNCYPLHPVSAILLPALCQRVAQNERTLFSYLGSHEEFGLQDMVNRFDTTDEFIYPHHVYDYFITNQPAALGDYRTHRRWAEVVTAIERLGDAPDESLNLLKTIGLLNIIGVKGGFKPSKALLGTCSESANALNRSLKSLSDRSIITYRRFSGEYRVWQGSDFDLEEAVEEELNNLGEFSLANELNNANALMPIVARRYTIHSGALRYFTPEFVDAQTYKKSDQKTHEPRIIFFLASAKDDEALFIKSVIQHYSDLDLVALCLNGTQLREATAEVLALRQVQNKRQELHSDPVAKREFEDRLTAAELAERSLLQRLQERPQECEWYFQAEKYEVDAKRDFQELLSWVLESVYSKSPILHNELINRDRPSAQANAARNKLLEAMMDNPLDKEDLGIEKFPPEKAIYRSVIAATGLHNKETKEFQEPHKESPFYHVWKEINLFLDSTEQSPRSLAELNKVLMAPPYGVKAGVLPILYIAAYIIYQHELALYENRQYKPVMTQEMVDRFVKRPDEFTFQRFRITGLRSSIYKEYCKVIDTGSNQTVVQLVKPLAQFIGNLPDYTQKTKSSDLSLKAKRVRDAFNLAKSPEHLIFEDIPKALGYEKELSKEEPNLEGLSQSLQGCLKELNDNYPNMIKRQLRMLSEAFNIDRDSGLVDLRMIVSGRYKGLEQHTVDVDGLKAFIKRLTKRQGDDETWLENVLMFLGQKPTRKWTDTNCSEVDVKLSDYAKRILDLETLRVHYDKEKSKIDGEFDVILLKSLKKGNEPVNEVVTIDRRRKEAIQDCKEEIYSAIKKHSDRELQLAALAEVVDEFLNERRKPSSNENHSDARIKEVKDG